MEAFVTMPSLRAYRGLVGAAGEYYLAAELSRRGWLATVTIKNSPGTDVLAQDTATGRVIALQTKTASAGSAFRLSAKDERTTPNDNEWYALVRLRSAQERPDFFLVPRNVAATLIYVAHRWWLSQPGRGGRQRNDSTMRVIEPHAVEQYREQWEWLAEATRDVVFEVGDWTREKAKLVGLQDGHPETARVGV